jgi:hypothetical protein
LPGDRAPDRGSQLLEAFPGAAEVFLALSGLTFVNRKRSFVMLPPDLLGGGVVA